MELATFIEENMERILEDWEEFASTLRPAAESMDAEQLRNLATAILRTVCQDMRRSRSEPAERSRSTQALKGERTIIGRFALDHAAERLSEGFSLNQLLAEYRALRGSVTRLWREHGDLEEDALEQMMRFDDAVDESMAEAVGWYNSRIEDARDLLNGVLAHDLRSPLGAIMTAAEVLLMDESLRPQHTATAARIRSSGARMQKMIDDLLDFTRTRLGTGLPIEATADDLGRIVRSVVEERRSHHPAAEIECSVSDDLAGAWDVGRIEQMLSNLINNAIHHGREGEPVTVTAASDETHLRVAIHNEGRAIRAEEQEVIFDPLRRAAVRGREDAQAGRGIGLGLYIARQIAEAHGGEIDLTSSEEHGTTFTVRLPRRARPGTETAGVTS